MGKVYKFPNEYLVDCGYWGKIEVSAHSHAEAKYLAYVIFRDYFGAWVWEDYNECITSRRKCKVTLLWFASIVKSVKMTIKSVLNY